MAPTYRSFKKSTRRKNSYVNRSAKRTSARRTSVKRTSAKRTSTKKISPKKSNNAYKILAGTALAAGLGTAFAARRGYFNKPTVSPKIRDVPIKSARTGYDFFVYIVTPQDITLPKWRSVSRPSWFKLPNIKWPRLRGNSSAKITPA